MKTRPLNYRNLIEINIDTTEIIADGYGYSLLQDDFDAGLLLDLAEIEYDLDQREEALEEIKAIAETELQQRIDEFQHETAEQDIRDYFENIGKGLPSFEMKFEFRSRYCDQLCDELEAEWEERSINA